LAVVFVLLGSGDQDILRAFQITFVGALVFGVVSLLVATRAGPVGVRDGLGLLAGLLSLMCSGVGIAMVAAVAAGALIARGWRVALLYSTPLAGIYLLWWWTYARDATYEPVTVRQTVSFAASAVREAFSQMGHLKGVGLLIILVTAAGLLLAWRHFSDGLVRRRAAGPAGLLWGLAVFVGLTAWSRANNGNAFAAQSRYVHIIVALALPAIAVAVDALLRRWLVLTPFAVALLLVGVPGNLDISWNQTGQGRGERSDRSVYLAFAQIPEAAGAADSVRPDPTAATELTLGWLRKGIADGRVPVPATISPKVAADARFRLSLQLIFATRRLADCSPVGKGQTVHLDQGQSIGVRNKIRVTDVTAKGENQPPALVFDGGIGRELQAYRGPLDLKITSEDDPPAELCTTILKSK
jgi:MFS family permease